MSEVLPDVGPLLGRLDEAQRTVLAGVGERKDVPSGFQILGINDVNTNLYVVLEGRVEVRLGQMVALRSAGTLGPGDFFGEISMLEPGLTSAEICAVDDTVLLQVPIQALDEMEREQTDTAAAIFKALVRESARRMRAMDRELTDSLYWLLV
jgi:CRP-like cAMP-binding protein